MRNRKTASIPCIRLMVQTLLYTIFFLVVGCGSDEEQVANPKANPKAFAPSATEDGAKQDLTTNLIYDPCRLVALKEAEDILGGPVMVDQKTPQPQNDNHCNYKSKKSYQNQITVTVNNSRGYSPGAKLQRDINQGKTAVEGIGDIATVFHSPAGFSAIYFADKDVGVGITVSGISDREQRVGVIASEAAKRIHSGDALYQVPGTEAFAGTWLATMTSTDIESFLGIKAIGDRGDFKTLVSVNSEGDYKGVLRLQFSGQLEFDGRDWYSWDLGANKRAGHGQMEVDGNEMGLDGDIDGKMRRVPCNQPPVAIKEDKELLRPLIGWSVWHGNKDVTPPEGYVGLWEGKGEIFDQDARLLLAIGDNSNFILLVLLDLEGELKAGKGSFVLETEGHKTEKGTYQFAGGIQQGNINLVGQFGTQLWQAYTPGLFNDKIDRPLLGYCPNQPRKKFM
jgi:hypothetical protein